MSQSILILFLVVLQYHTARFPAVCHNFTAWPEGLPGKERSRNSSIPPRVMTAVSIPPLIISDNNEIPNKLLFSQRLDETVLPQLQKNYEYLPCPDLV